MWHNEYFGTGMATIEFNTEEQVFSIAWFFSGCWEFLP